MGMLVGGHSQLQRLPLQSQAQGRVVPLQSLPGSTGTMFSITMRSSSSCSCCMQLS